MVICIIFYFNFHATLENRQYRSAHIYHYKFSYFYQLDMRLVIFTAENLFMTFHSSSTLVIKVIDSVIIDIMRQT